MVYLDCVPLFKEHFWGHVFRRATKTIGEVIFSHVGFRKSEIRNSDMSIDINKDVFRFDISVNNTQGMQVKHSEANLAKVKLGLLLVHNFNLP